MRLLPVKKEFRTASELFGRKGFQYLGIPLTRDKTMKAVNIANIFDSYGKISFFLTFILFVFLFFERNHFHSFFSKSIQNHAIE